MAVFTCILLHLIPDILEKVTKIAYEFILKVVRQKITEINT